MKKKKRMRKTQYMESNRTVLNFVTQLIICGFLFAAIIYSLPL